MTRVALLAVLLVAPGCTLVVLGDSNSCIARPCGPDNWPGLLQRHIWYRGWRVVNRGRPGMTAGRFFNPVNGQDVQTGDGEYAAAAFELEKIIADLHLVRACRWYPGLAPALVLALGTNDIPFHDGAAVADDILALRARVAGVAPCVRVYVGTVPPRVSAGGQRDGELAHANALLRAHVPPDRLIDFSTGFGPADLGADGVHVTPDAQAKRAEHVWQALFHAG